MIDRFRGLRLLVIDGNADARELLTLTFVQEGAEVIAVASVREALEVMERLQPDILISEILFSEEDGYSLIRWVKQQEAERGSWIPAIAVTVAAGKQNCDRVLSAGFQGYLSKPVDIDELASLVARLARGYVVETQEAELSD
jgi:CheY-like chemotaxis protein